ncbi:malto-oligosyltrehalose synthase [Methylopila sp. M107]|uniref:malto-oligosyltrehalose synthase n=1 Tax=Methylopila sp. M107 TaxID=1101190 RepID=UPI0003A671E3|nr:malto-oligosyltrehalose synthase [Methylopila sp. M107]
MRMQFQKDFPFERAIALAPYLKALGISHLYSSPILTARAGSNHGYDVIDPTTVNPELGGEEGFRALVAALRKEGLGIIVDIVPNHMAVGGDDNEWWLDVLAYGQGSRFGHFFDIDWEPADPALAGKVLLPTLGMTYGEALRSGELKITREAKRGGLALRYADHLFPLRPQDRYEIEEAGLDAYDASTDEGRARLHTLLEKQNWRLAYWMVAGDEINWRRFFDVNELAGLRIADPAVFEATHEKLLSLYAEGLIDGFRVDHVDGLMDPGGYSRRLREHLDARQSERPGDLAKQRAYLVIEKILGPGEHLADDWGVDGASGYDFMDDVSALLHDPSGEKPLGALWEKISGRTSDFHVEEEAARREILDRSFSAQLDQAAEALHRVARLDFETRDTSRAAIRRALVELLAHFPAYRTYANAIDGRTEDDKPIFARALDKARVSILPADAPVLDVLDRFLGGDVAPPEEQRPLRDKAIRRFQQLSAPVAAKAVEDTAFYRYGKLLSRTDVGFDVASFSNDVATFHAKMAAKLAAFPDAMVTTATHDHKRGEDVRARLAVLSEVPDEWAAALKRWNALAEPLRDGEVPSPGDEAILYQTLVGAWPLGLAPDDADGCKAFADRVAGWQEKALRESKLATDWSAPNEPYETAARNLLTGLMTGPDAALRTDIAAFASRIGAAGAANGLIQTLLRLTVPGVPDTYQGTEFWDLSLVDPDNRRPVDYPAREAALARATSALDAAAHWRDGAVKQALLAAALTLRADAPNLFAEGGYRPLEVQGPDADDVVAFARTLGDEAAIVVALLRPTRHLEPGTLRPTKDLLQQNSIALPQNLAATQTIERYSGRSVSLKPLILLDEILSGPIALLASRN